MQGVADNIGVDRPSGSNVPVSTSYSSLSQASTSKYAYTQKAGVLIGDGYNGNEVTNALNTLQQYGVFVDIISERLGTVIGNDGTTLQVDKTFLTSSPYLVDSLYVIGGSSRNQVKFNSDITEFVHVAYKHYTINQLVFPQLVSLLFMHQKTIFWLV